MSITRNTLRSVRTENSEEFSKQVPYDRFLADYVEPLSVVFRSLIQNPALRQAMEGTFEQFSQVDLPSFLHDHTVSPQDFQYASQLVSFQKKLPLSSAATLKAALVEAIRCELDCSNMNVVLSSLVGGEHFCVLPHHALELNTLLYEVSYEISKMLGDVPTFDELNFEFGPGACINVPKAGATTANKLNVARPTCSKSLLKHVPRLAEQMPHLAPLLDRIECVPARLDFVPKNSKIDRPIAVEPWLNTMFQKAIGERLSYDLRRFAHIDIRDQTLNKRAAKYGSLTGEYATIDLSSASDTICYELCRQVLPDEWFELLCSARSSEMTFRGITVPCAKFSSMGNGFTFPLQTMIFHAIGRVACKRVGLGHSVLHTTYGDDIIVPTGAFGEMITCLQLLGFRPNSNKSFGSGRFRESCGGDFVDGIDTRPVYAKDFAPYRLLFRLYNRYSCPVIRRAVMSLIPPRIRIYGPPLYGDGHLHQYGYIGPRPFSSIGWCGHTFRTYSEQCKSDVVDLGLRPLDYVLPIYEISRGLPDRQTKYHNGRACLDRPKRDRKSVV